MILAIEMNKLLQSGFIVISTIDYKSIMAVRKNPIIQSGQRLVIGQTARKNAGKEPKLGREPAKMRNSNCVTVPKTVRAKQRKLRAVILENAVQVRVAVG